jgi:hypothetical protein
MRSTVQDSNEIAIMLRFIERLAPKFEREHVQVVSNRCFDLSAIGYMLMMYSLLQSRFLRRNQLVVSKNVVDFHRRGVKQNPLLLTRRTR